MSVIERVEILQVNLPPKVRRTDAIQSFVTQETPMVRIVCADGAVGTGYTYTIGTGARLLATDGLGHTRILRDRHVVDSAVHFVTRRVRTHALALAA